MKHRIGAWHSHNFGKKILLKKYLWRQYEAARHHGKMQTIANDMQSKVGDAIRQSPAKDLEKMFAA